MGTTLTVALVDDGTVTFGHVGDSRAYLLRDGAARAGHRGPLARRRARARGKLSPEEAESHPQRSVITRALGTEPDVDVDTFTVEAEEGRPLPALLRRPHRDGRRRDDPGDVDREPRRPDAAAQGAGPGGEQAAAARTTSPSSCFEVGDGGRANRGRAVSAVGAGDDDEDTLSELDGVPVDRGPARPGRRRVATLAPSRPATSRAARRRGQRSLDRRASLFVPRDRRRPGSSASRARTSSAPRRTATSPSTRGSPGTSSAATSTAGLREPRAAPPSSRRPSGAALRPRPASYDAARAPSAVRAQIPP